MYDYYLIYVVKARGREKRIVAAPRMSTDIPDPSPLHPHAFLQAAKLSLFLSFSLSLSPSLPPSLPPSLSLSAFSACAARPWLCTGRGCCSSCSTRVPALPRARRTLQTKRGTERQRRRQDFLHQGLLREGGAGADLRRSDESCAPFKAFWRKICSSCASAWKCTWRAFPDQTQSPLTSPSRTRCPRT